MAQGSSKDKRVLGLMEFWRSRWTQGSLYAFFWLLSSAVNVLVDVQGKWTSLENIAIATITSAILWLIQKLALLVYAQNAILQALVDMTFGFKSTPGHTTPCCVRSWKMVVGKNLLSGSMESLGLGSFDKTWRGTRTDVFIF